MLTNEGTKRVGKIIYCKTCSAWSTLKKGKEVIQLPCGHTGKTIVVDVLGGISELTIIDIKEVFGNYIEWHTD